MQNILLVIDMQTDFVDGALGTPEAVAILPYVRKKIEHFEGRVIFTRDTHEEDYLATQEGKHLPVPHCIRGTKGWEIHPALSDLVREVVDKPTFGSLDLLSLLKEAEEQEPIGKITLIGLCTDICVISNAMLVKAAFTEAEIAVDAACSAGVSPESHARALAAMRVCQIHIEND